jgi:hypothetical protein
MMTCTVCWLPVLGTAAAAALVPRRAGPLFMHACPPPQTVHKLQPRDVAVSADLAFVRNAIGPDAFVPDDIVTYVSPHLCICWN